MEYQRLGSSRLAKWRVLFADGPARDIASMTHNNPFGAAGPQGPGDGTPVRHTPCSTRFPHAQLLHADERLLPPKSHRSPSCERASV